MYTKDLKAHRGTDNQILLEFVNQDQKRVNLTRYTAIGDPVDADALVPGQLYCITTEGNTDWSTVGATINCPAIEGTKFTATGPAATTTEVGTATPIELKNLEFTFRLISHDGTKLLLEKPLTIVNRTQGQTKIVLTEEELDLILENKVGFSVEQTADGSLYEPVYVDDNSNARGFMYIVDSVMPEFVASEILTIPAQTIPPPDYVTSVLSTHEEPFLTFQFLLDQWTGDIIVEGAADTDNNWYTIQTENVGASDLHLFNVEGYHPYIRFTIPEIFPALNIVVGGEYEIVTSGTTDYTLIGWDGVSATFTATGTATGDGTVKSGNPSLITEIRYR